MGARRERLDRYYDTGPALGAVDAELVTRMLYDMDYGIFDHEEKGQDNPLAAVLYHPQEDLIEGSMHYEIIRNYRMYDINNTFGMSLEEYRNLPIYEYEFINDISRREMQEKTKEMNRMHNELSDTGKK